MRPEEVRITKKLPVWSTSREVLIETIDGQITADHKPRDYLVIVCPSCQQATHYRRDEVPTQTTGCPKCGAPHIEYGEAKE